MFLFSHLRCWVVGLILAVSIPVFAWSQGTYTSNFSQTENPISEGGKWFNGGSVGSDWANVRTTPGLAFGTQPGNLGGNARYADSTAVLAGTWGPNQTVQGTIAVTNASNAPEVYQEVELRLRTAIKSHQITGYEVNCSISCNPKNFYLQIVRWNGPLNSWKLLGARTAHGVNGDVLKATINGSTITAYLNGAEIFQVTDGTFTSGSPGIGFYLQGATGLNPDFGFSNFTASDGSDMGGVSLPAASPKIAP